MKLISLNAWNGRLKELLIEYIRAENADIVCLQEVISIPDNPGLFRSFEQIQQAGGYEHSFFAPTHSFHYMNRTAQFGNAMLSRFPLKNRDTVFTNLTYKENFDYATDSYDIRNFQHATFVPTNRPCHVINYQGHHLREHKQGDQKALEQTSILAKYTDTLDGPLIIVGDFNLAPSSPALASLSALHNLSAIHHLNTTRTPLTRKTEVCDYIFVNDQINVTMFAARDDVVSDHKALVIEFEL